MWEEILQLGNAHYPGLSLFSVGSVSLQTWVLSWQSRVAPGAPQVDLLYLHNAAEMQLEALGKRRFVELLAAAFREMEKFR